MLPVSYLSEILRQWEEPQVKSLKTEYNHTAMAHAKPPTKATYDSFVYFYSFEGIQVSSPKTISELRDLVRGLTHTQLRTLCSN